MDWHLVALIIHLIGFALGLGGATLSDILFFKSIRAGKLSGSELAILTTLSRVIWIGLGLLIVSGLSIFAIIYAERDSLPMLASPRWQAKLTLVAIVLLNGFIFKYYIFPFLRLNAGQPVSLQTLGSKLWRLAITGAISIVSWYSILIISTLPREFQPPYWNFMAVWIVLVVLGSIASRYLLKRVMK